jgi:AcrR family transcriptional regulator
MKPLTPILADVHQPIGRERLLKAAKAVFLRQRLDTVTVDDICRAAGLSKGGFYHHFRNKEEVFLLVALEELERELERLARSAPRTRTTGSADALLLDLWSWAARHPRARRQVRNMHRHAVRELSRPGRARVERSQAATDREAPAMLALILGTGRIARSALDSQAYGGEREQKKAAAG